MTPRKPFNELKRPNRAFGEGLRALVRCPLSGDYVKVVAYRHSSVRFECEGCGLRFSIGMGSWDFALSQLDESGRRPSPDRLMALMIIPPRPTQPAETA